MDADTIKIKCPQCGTILKIDVIPGLEHKKVMCSRCSFTALVANFRPVGKKPADVDPATPKTHTSIPRPGANNNPVGKHAPADNPAPQPLRDSINKKFGKGAGSVGGTVINPATKLPLIGKLRDENGMLFPLSFGLNTVGRDAPTSTAKIRLSDPENRMSREHIVIEVKMTAAKTGNFGGGTVLGSVVPSVIHTVRLSKQQVNKTYLNDLLMCFGFEYTLGHGDVLKLPGNKIITFILE